jgi:hypothetical protein
VCRLVVGQTDLAPLVLGLLLILSLDELPLEQQVVVHALLLQKSQQTRSPWFHCNHCILSHYLQKPSLPYGSLLAESTPLIFLSQILNGACWGIGRLSLSACCGTILPMSKAVLVGRINRPVSNMQIDNSIVVCVFDALNCFHVIHSPLNKSWRSTTRAQVQALFL